MNVEYHDDLVLVQRNYVVELPSITPIIAMKYLSIDQRTCSRSTGEKAVTEKGYIYQFYIIPAVRQLWVVQEPYSTHPTTSYVMSAHLANTPTYPRLLYSHIALVH